MNILPVDLPRPRDRADQEFVRMRKSIHDELLGSGSENDLAPEPVSDNF
jgi:hypothetical protein